MKNKLFKLNKLRRNNYNTHDFSKKIALEILEKKGITKYRFNKDIGIPGSIEQVLRGSEFSVQTLMKIEDTFNVRIFHYGTIWKEEQNDGEK